VPIAGLDGLSDCVLMERTAEGDPDAFVCLFQRYAPTAMALTHRILRRSHLAEEAVQEAFLAVWRHPERYSTKRGTVRSWLMSTVHHKAVDLVRREDQRSGAAKAAAVVVTDEESADPGDVVVAKTIEADAKVAVQLALASLPPAQRQIIELMYFGGLTQLQISKRLSLPLGTVKSRTLLGMRRLQVALGVMER
jgi:RNA polymerase sigma factor (sigma-70 family)